MSMTDIYYKISQIEDIRVTKVRKAKIIDKVYRIFMALIVLILEFTIVTGIWQSIVLSCIVFIVDAIVSNFVENYISLYSGESIGLNNIKKYVKERESLYAAIVQNPSISTYLYNDYSTAMMHIQYRLDDIYLSMQ